MDFQINGYQLIENCDEAIYAAKTKEDVYQYYIENYGDTETSKEQFLNGLFVYDLSSEDVHKIRDFINDDTGEDYISSYYQQYKDAAIKDTGCQPVLFMNI